MSDSAARLTPRHPEGGGYPRGTETRARIIASAIGVFGRRGFDQASTREIAAEAGVKTAALHYYFSGKTGLYQACIDVVTARIAARLTGLVAEADRRLAKNLSLQELVDLYCSIQGAALAAIYSPDEGVITHLLLGKGIAAEELAAARGLMRQRVIAPVFRVTSALIGRIMGRDPDDPEVALNTVAVNGIALAFRWVGEDSSHALDWHGKHPEDLAGVQAIVRRQSAIVLRGLAVHTGQQE